MDLSPGPRRTDTEMTREHRTWLAALAGGIALASCGDSPSAAPSVADSAASRHAGAGFILRPAPLVQGCTPPRSVPDRRAPAAVRRAIPALQRAATSIDGLPVLNRADGQGSADAGWLPVHSVDPKGTRRIEGSEPALYVVASATVLRLTGSRIGASCGAALSAPSAPGACLLTGPPGGPFGVRCWTLQQIEAGRALALTGPGASATLIGFAPRRARAIRIAATSRKPLIVSARDGVIRQPTQLRPGTRLTTRATP
jgi:hypothetical protein